MSRSRFTDPGFKVPASLLGRRRAAVWPPSRQRFEIRLLVVERRVDLGALLRLGRLLRLRLVGLRRLSAEVEPEARQVDAAAAVGVDLLERGQQGLALVGLLRHLLARPDVDRAVALQAGGGRDNLPAD